MKKIYILLSILYSLNSFGQEKHELNPCGTPPEYQETHFHDIDFSRGVDDTILYVPLSVHLVSDDNSNVFGGIRYLDAFNRLLVNYEGTNIRFYMEGDIRRIKNSKWNSHNTIPEGWDMMKNSNIANTINTYFVNKAAGNCGYNLPYGGVANSRGCSGPTDNTWAHELGHNLRLPHPFIGWEGNKYDPTKPTPTKVTYDYTLFKDSIILDKTIIDTAFVEMADGSNCAIAADQICDTKADYIATRWNCDNNKQSPNTYKDPNNQTFKVDGTLFMSYSNDACQNRFSDDQIKIMRGTLKGKKKNLLYNQVMGNPLGKNATTLISPADKAKIPSDNILLQWDKVENATKYIVEITRLSSFSSIDFEFTTDKTELVVNNLPSDKIYYWRVRGYNNYFGGLTSLRNSFTTINTSSVKNIDQLKDILLYPNPIQNDNLQVRINLNENIEAKITLTDIAGRCLYVKNAMFSAGNQSFEIPFQNLSTGLYFFNIQEKNGGFLSKKVVKQ